MNDSNRLPAWSSHAPSCPRAFGALFGLLVLAAQGWALSPAQLSRLMADSESLTIVDVRSTALYQKGHIPGAINLPASLLPQKALPALGRVVVYGEGLGRDNPAEAVADLNRKPGIRAEALEGGFAGWESAGGATTRAGGVQPEELPYITYAQLKSARLEEMVLVDLRQRPSASPQNLQRPESQPPLTDLNQEFPGARIIHSYRPQSLAPNFGSGPAPVLVLIDAGDGQAENMGRTLKATGQKRFVILIGGESILARKGQPGLQRSGVGSITQNATSKP